MGLHEYVDEFMLTANFAKDMVLRAVLLTVSKAFPESTKIIYHYPIQSHIDFLG